MRVVFKTGTRDIATLYVGETAGGKMIEFVESVQPPLTKGEKWVLIISTLYGCPIGCPICDAGGRYRGILSEKDLFDQIDYMVKASFPSGKVRVKKFKIQFARMGEPSLNPNVLKVLGKLPRFYQCKGLMPSISTVAPEGRERFFQELLEIKGAHYGEGNFQFQFSVHATDQGERDRMIPVKKWNFARMAEYGKAFFKRGDRKISLNFALSRDTRLNTGLIARYFDPAVFLIKITPVNPTLNARRNRIQTLVSSEEDARDLPVAQELRGMGYEVIVSVGELEENRIGSNCGQYLKYYLENKQHLTDAYTYPLSRVV